MRYAKLFVNYTHSLVFMSVNTPSMIMWYVLVAGLLVIKSLCVLMSLVVLAVVVYLMAQNVPFILVHRVFYVVSPIIPQMHVVPI